MPTTEYLVGVAQAFGSGAGDPKVWFDKPYHILKQEENKAQIILEEMRQKWEIMDFYARSNKVIAENLSKVITYFTNQPVRMNYNKYRDQNLPVGSGVTEAACKTLIKQRLCNCGRKWKNTGAQIVISLRAMARTDGRWKQFWDKKLSMPCRYSCFLKLTLFVGHTLIHFMKSVSYENF